MRWTDDLDNQLKALWGTMRTQEVGDALCVTKNAAIGRAHRLGLAKLPNHQARPKRERRIRKRWVEKPIEAVFPVHPVLSLDIAFHNLEPTHCRYPVSGERDAMLFCGNPKEDGHSYCPWHHNIVRHHKPGSFDVPRPYLRKTYISAAYGGTRGYLFYAKTDDAA